MDRLGTDRVNEELVSDYEGGKVVHKFRFHMDIPLNDEEAAMLLEAYQESFKTGDKSRVKRLLREFLGSNAPASAHRVIDALDDNMPVPETRP